MLQTTRYALFAALVTLPAMHAAADDITRQDIRIVTTPADYHAAVGDTVAFEVSLVRDGQTLVGRELAYVLSWDTLEEIERGTFTTDTQPKSISTKATKPGFVRLWVYPTTKNGERHERNESGVAVDPLKIQPRQPMPDDFESWWASKKKLVYDTPMYPHLTPVDSGIEGFETFDLQINAPGGLNCSGYYGRPKDAKPGSLPAILYVHPSGVYSSWISNTKKGATWNAIVYDMNAHGVPNGIDRDYYVNLEKTTLKGYHGFGLDDRETSYYLGMFMRMIRGLQFLKSQPEWDGKTLIIRGSSKGGGQAIAGGGIDEDVTLIVAGIPFLCDRLENYWYGPEYDALSEAERGPYSERVRATSAYFDAVNFARISKAKAIFTTGFVDTTCKPSGNYAAFNQLQNPDKAMVDLINRGHGFDWGAVDMDGIMDEMLEHYLKTGEVPPGRVVIPD